MPRLIDTPFYGPVNDFNAYWDQFKNTNGSVNEHDWPKLMRMLDELSAKNNMGVFLWSARTPTRFRYFSDQSKMLGYNAELFTGENGVAFSASKFHPDYLHFAYLQNEIGFRYFQDNGLQPGDNVTKTFNGLYKRADDNYIHGLQQTTLLDADTEGKPLMTIGFLHNVAYIKKAGTAAVTIAAKGNVEICKYNFNLKCLEEVKPFSEQERKVLRLLGNGLSSKDIAEKLNISTHTADTHRRNLLRKTDCIDTTALVVYAGLIGLL